MEDCITRHLINPDMLLHEHDVKTGELVKTYTRDEFCTLIDRWKIVLVDKYDVKPGQTICPLLWPSISYYALVFAAAELGLTFIVGWPHCEAERDLYDHKVSMWGKIDYVVIHSDHAKPDHPKYVSYWEMERNYRYGKTLCYEEDLYTYDINQCTRITEIINTPATCGVVW
jgi:acyl-coenzyme A synthetase/AMP-(fatty) acid ligase